MTTQELMEFAAMARKAHITTIVLFVLRILTPMLLALSTVTEFQRRINLDGDQILLTVLILKFIFYGLGPANNIKFIIPYVPISPCCRKIFYASHLLII